MVSEDNNQLNLMCEEVALDNGVQRSVISSFIVNITKTEEEHPYAYQLLSVMSVLDGSSMDEEFLKLCFSQNKLEYIKAKRILQSFNMVKCNNYTQESTLKKINYLTLHSLYQLSIQHYLHVKQAISNVIEKCLEMMYSIVDNLDVQLTKYLEHIWKHPEFKQNRFTQFFHGYRQVDKYHLTILITRNIVQETLESYKERIDHINLYKMRSFPCCLSIVNDKIGRAHV